MNPLRCLVVDDEPLAVKLISGYVERTPFLVLEALARSAVEALSLLGERRFDLVFLDIQMPGLTGVEFAEMLPESTRVVFITAYTDFALDGFRVNALDYLLKPVSYDDFRRAASRALNFYSERQARTSDIDVITVKSEYRLRRIPVSDIRYVEGLKDYVKIYVEGEINPVLTLMSMKTLEQILPSDSFMRVHRSFIINMDYVRTVERNRILFGQESVPVSDSYKREFFRRIGAGSECPEADAAEKE